MPVSFRIVPATAFALLLLAVAGAKDLFTPVARVPIDDGTHVGWNPELTFRSDVSRRNLLDLDRSSPFSLPTGKRGMPLELASALADTINILVLKIEFQREVPDDPKTTGDGTFDMRSYDQFYSEEGHYIDPAPHNTSYFNSHMEALRRFWYFASDKKLNLTWDIYPQAESLAYRLPERMSYYGSEGDSSSIVGRLSLFFHDAITLADTSTPGIDFSNYSSVILFHAGSDQQNNIPFINDTPDDFFTGFIVLSDPVYVDSGAAEVQEGLIVPETASQDNRVTAINAVLAHEFGHQLGLVDLYNTATFMTQVGDFALMDNNGMSVGVQFPDIWPTVGGTMPVYPCAWSRAYLGFDMPRELTLGTQIPLSAVAQQYDSTEIVKVPVTEFEYFLVENRQADVDTLEAGYPFDNVLIGDSLTGVILGPGYAYFEGNDTVLVADAEYDRLLPGDGAPVWHIDEYVAYESSPVMGLNNFQANTLQWDATRRFLTLVEADGVIEFGGNYYRGYGDARDLYKYGNNTALTPFSNPSSQSNLGGDTHIFMTDFSSSDTLMTFDLDIDWYLPGWPQMSHPQYNSAPSVIDIDGDGFSEVMSVAGNRLLIHRHNGERFFDNADSIGIYGFDNSVIYFPWAVAAVCDTALAARPIPVDFDDDGYFEIATYTLSGNLYAFTRFDDDFDGRADPIAGFPIQLSSGQTAFAAASDIDSVPGMEIEAFDINGVCHLINSSGQDSALFSAGGAFRSASIHSDPDNNMIDVAFTSGNVISVSRYISSAGSLDFTREFSTSLGQGTECYIVSGDIDRDGGAPEIVAVTPSSIVLIEPDGSVGWRFQTGATMGRPALGDINADGYPEIVVAGESEIYALAYNGALMTNFPVDLSFFDLGGVISAQPVLGDVDGDGRPDIIVGLPAGGIYAFNYNADMVGGFPLPSSFEIENTGAFADIDNDGDLDLLTIEGSGAIGAWDISSPYAQVNVPWPFEGGDIFNRGYLSPAFDKPIITGDVQLPEGSVYNYPNPASNSTTIRFYLSSDSDVSIEVFDFMGERVKSAAMRGLAHVNNEYVWDCSNYASGVYFCRVQADDGTSKDWRMIKIALVK